MSPRTLQRREHILSDNADVYLFLNRSQTLHVATALLFAISATAPAQTLQSTLTKALSQTNASAVVLDMTSGKVLASVGPPRRRTPGSSIKPLLLDYALVHGIVRADTEVYCRRDLHIGARALPCTHPTDHPVFTAETALAESCNTWFAATATRYTGPQLQAALDTTRLPHASMMLANPEQRELAVLGLKGVTASPLELAQAYRALLLHTPANGAVAQGLTDSVSYGMANQASVKGLSILGKTGTASNPGEAWTHGWFAGALPNRLVLVIFVPHGDGGTAALLAHKFFQTMAKE